MANILDLSSKAAHNFLMDSDNYFTTELPEYIDFSPVLKCADKRVKNIDLLNVAPKAAMQQDVNLCMLYNKDGRYGVRPLTLANPFLYAMMVQHVCDKRNWKRIVDCFKKFTCDGIIACSIPQVKYGEDEPLWNNNWMLAEIDATLPVLKICDRKKLKAAAHVIDFRERRTYSEE